MSHEIYRTNGKDSMAYTMQKPWHGLGQEIDPNATIDEWIKTAQLDWEVLRSQCSFQIPGAGFRDSSVAMPFGGRHVLYRSDNFAPLHTVSSKYKIVQPADVMGFYRELVAFMGYKMETAGSLDMGRRVWALASTGSTIDLGHEDKLKTYLMLATDYSASFSTTAKFTTVRVVCNNTLEAAMLSNGRLELPVVKVPHAATFNAKIVQEKLGIAQKVEEGFAEICYRLAGFPLSEYDAAFILFEVAEERERVFSTMWELYNGGPGCEFPTAKGTAWGVLNAVTCYVDHYKQAMSSNNRLRSSWFGPGFSMKHAAFDLLVRAAKIN